MSSWPTSIHMRAVLLQRGFINRKLVSHLVTHGRLTIMHRFNGQAPDEANVARHLASLESRLDGYEAILSKQKYLAGNVSYIESDLSQLH